jgi:hypothetical protein
MREIHLRKGQLTGEKNDNGLGQAFPFYAFINKVNEDSRL